MKSTSTATDRTKGSLMIEVLFALSITTIALIAVVTAFKSAQQANLVIREDLTTISALMFALDDISREMKVSGAYKCDIGSNPTNTDSCNKLNMTRVIAGNDDVQYRLHSGSIEKRVGGSGGWPALTPDSIDVTAFNVVLRTTPGDDTPDYIIVTASGKSVGGESPTEVHLQTTVTARY